MKIVRLLLCGLILANCAPPTYNFDYNSEKNFMSGAPGSDFPSIPAYIDSPAMGSQMNYGKQPNVPQQANSSQNMNQSNNNPYGYNPYSTQNQNTKSNQYNNPYANPYGATPYGNNSQNLNQQKETTAKTKGTSPYSGYISGKNQMFLKQNNNEASPNNAPQQNPYATKSYSFKEKSNNIRKQEQSDRYRGLTKTNKYQVIDSNIFTENDRSRFELIDPDVFEPNNDFEKYRPMYENKRSRKTQDFVDSIQGSLLEEMIENDPISNGFGLENIPKY